MCLCNNVFAQTVCFAIKGCSDEQFYKHNKNYALGQICRPSPAMVTSPYWWEILKWDEKSHKEIKNTTLLCNRDTNASTSVNFQLRILFDHKSREATYISKNRNPQT